MFPSFAFVIIANLPVVIGIISFFTLFPVICPFACKSATPAFVVSKLYAVCHNAPLPVAFPVISVDSPKYTIVGTSTSIDFNFPSLNTDTFITIAATNNNSNDPNIIINALFLFFFFSSIDTSS